MVMVTQGSSEGADNSILRQDIRHQPRQVRPAARGADVTTETAATGVRRSLFQEHWWCDASSPGAWSSIEVALSSTRKVEFVFAITRKYGFTEVTMPYLSRVMDIADVQAAENPALSFADKLTVVREIIARLPRHDAMFYTLSPESEYELAFNVSGYTTESLHTFRCLSPTPDLLMKIDAKTRQNIRRAAKAFTVRQSDDIGTYFDVFHQYMREKKQTNHVEDAPFGRIWAATQQRGASTILNIHGADDKIVASTVLVWDHSYLYYWLSSRVPSKSKNSANSLLVWKALELAQSKGLIFDMDGFNSPESGLFLSKYHLTPARRVKLHWESTRYTWVATTRAILKPSLPLSVRQGISKRLQSL
jgi:hypothetical protein